MLPYIAYMDPMGYTDCATLWLAVSEVELQQRNIFTSLSRPGMGAYGGLCAKQAGQTVVTTTLFTSMLN